MSDLPFDVPDEDDGGGEDILVSRVLVVDDEAVVLDVMNRLLSREKDLSVDTAPSAEVALERIREQRVDVLITDKNLPGMGGIELIEQARKTRPALEAVMITGYASAESVIAAFAAGASDYLVKPFDDLRAVGAKIRAALDRRKERSSLRQRSQELARDANALLAKGRDAPEIAWQRLEGALQRYEQSIREGGSGEIAVVDSPRAFALLERAKLPATLVGVGMLDGFDFSVVVLETSHPQWRQLAEGLGRQGLDVVLLAAESADLSDLLEALALRVELVGYGGKNTAGLPDRVRALYMRQAVHRARVDLSAALDAFRAALASASR